MVQIEWRGPCDYRAEDLLSHKNNGGGGKLEEAKSLLLDLLPDGPVSLAAIKENAVTKGISLRTLDRAKTELGVISRSEGFGPGSVMHWTLPHDER